MPATVVTEKHAASHLYYDTSVLLLLSVVFEGLNDTQALPQVQTFPLLLSH